MSRVWSAVMILGFAALVLAGSGESTRASDDPNRCLVEVEGLFPRGITGGSDAVLMVHGWTGSPDAWTRPIDLRVDRFNVAHGRSLVDQIMRFGDTDVWLLDYSITSTRWVTDPEVGGRVGRAIDCLADTYGRGIGVMAHSMGGLAVRQSFADDPDRIDRVAALVTFGTPHEGSDVAAVLAAALGVHHEPSLLLDSLTPAHVALLRTCGLLTTQSADACWPLPSAIAAIDSDAGRALRTNSRQLRDLPPMPTRLPVAALAGNIEFVGQISFGLFYQDLTRTSVGDGVVTVPSALAQGSETADWNCRYNLPNAPAASNAVREIFGIQQDDGTEQTPVGGVWDGIWTDRSIVPACFHSNLMRSVEVTTRAVGFLSQHLDDHGDRVVSALDVDQQRTISSRPGTDGPDPVVVVLDVSGSMREDDGRGVVRLDGAKAAITDMLFELPPRTPAGVWYYPDAGVHCDPGRALISLGPLDPARAASLVDTLEAAGNTPTGPALEAAVDAMRAAGYERGQLVLVSDGESNCGTPPCEVAQRLVAEGFDISVNTLGFQISDAGREELTCIANATGGLHADAEDSEELIAELVALTGAKLELEVTVPERVSSGLAATIAVTVGNPSSETAHDVEVVLDVQDVDGTLGLPTVRPPRYRLGNIPAGESVQRNWSVVLGSAGTAGTASARLTTASEDVAPVTEVRAIEVREAAPDAADGAGMLAEVAAGGGRVVVLGDSFSSGEGASAYLEGDGSFDTACHRSHHTYGGVLYGSDRLDLLACSGAVINDLRAPQGGREATPAQLDQLARLSEQPELVMLTLGGNDIGFSSIIKRCLQPGDCTDDHRFVYETLRDIQLLPDRLVSAYQDVSYAVDHAPVLVLGYPVPLPYAGSQPCTGFSTNEIVFGQHVVRELNRTTQRAVDTVRSEGFDVRFVPQVAQAVLPSNTACHPDPYIVSVDLLLGAGAATVDWLTGTAADLSDRRWWLVESEGTRLTQQLMHPNVDGYRSMAQAVTRWSTTTEESDEELVPPPRPPRPEPLRVSPTPDRTINLAVTGPGSVRHGQRLQVTADGFAGGSDVRLQVRSHPTVLAVTQADDEGRIDVAASLPEELAPGVHRLEAVGYDEESQSLTMSREIRIRPELPRWLLPVWIAAGVLGASGLAAWVWVRRDRRRTLRRGQASADPA